MNAKQHNPVLGVFWMLVTGALFVAVTAVVKYVGDGLPAAEAAFLRYLLGLVFLIPMIPAMRAATLTPKLYKIFAFRGVVHSLGVTLWFYSMTQISIAEVTAMNYLNPIYVTIAAALFLGEKLAFRRLAAILVALIGVLIILRPGFREVSSGHLAMLGTALSIAIVERSTDSSNKRRRSLNASSSALVRSTSWESSASPSRRMEMPGRRWRHTAGERGWRSSSSVRRTRRKRTCARSPCRGRESGE